MEEQNNKKKKIIIAVSILVLVSVIGGTLAYFMARATSSEQTITSANLEIVFDDSTSIINATDIEPINDDEILTKAAKKTFRISKKNNTGKDLYARIDLVDLNLSDNFKDYDLKWALYQGNTKLQEGTFNALADKTSIPMINNILLDSTTPKEYSLYIWIRETDLEQENLMDGIFKGKISVVAETKRTKYKDNSGANAPILAQGMIPVTYDEASEKWVKAESDERYYDYSSLMWANAVTVSEANRTTYMNANAGTPIEMDDINSMWVWVPRYKYKIPSDIGIGTYDDPILNPPQIDVVFESGTKASGVSETVYRNGITSSGINTNYYTHPAFRDGSKVYKSTPYDIGGWDSELEGIWIGKFWSSTDDSTCTPSSADADCINIDPIIKPDIIAGQRQNISTQFKTSIKFAGGVMDESTGKVTFNGNSKYGLTSSTNTHMMKSIEWGMVAYLSQSQYGKNGNNNYETTNKEMFMNNSSGNYTGRSGGAPSGLTIINETYPDKTSSREETIYGFYTYDDYFLTYNKNEKTIKVKGKGTGASTTGTIYGIYDMSSSNGTNVMGNDFNYTGQTEFRHSGFNGNIFNGNGYDETVITNGISFPERKYYDLYNAEIDGNNNPKAKSILGDAKYETMAWYEDTRAFTNKNYPWSRRGGKGGYSATSGIFSSSYGSGEVGTYKWRGVLIP